MNVVAPRSNRESTVIVKVNGIATASPVLPGTSIAREDGFIETPYSVPVELEAGKNVVTAVASNINVTSNTARVEVFRRVIEARKPATNDLYVLAIGISKYKNPAFNLGYADRDAKQIAAEFKSQQGKLYNQVSSRVVCDEEASVKGIKKGMEWLSQSAKGPKDTAIVIISAHGYFDEFQQWRLFTHDVEELDQLEATSLGEDEVMGWFNKRIRANTVLFVDACHAGGITGARPSSWKAKGPPRRDPWQGSGKLTLLSSLPSEQSVELKDRGHGAFAFAILEALRSPQISDSNKDGELSFTELEMAVKNSVKKLTEDTQHPTQHKPSDVSEVTLFKF